MADTQVGSGAEISKKVSLSRPRGAARLRRRTSDPDSPEGSPASSRFFALWYRIRSPREFGNKSAEHVLRGDVVGKVEVSSGGFLDQAARSLIVRRDQSARVLCLSDRSVLLLESRTPETRSGAEHPLTALSDARLRLLLLL